MASDVETHLDVPGEISEVSSAMNNLILSREPVEKPSSTVAIETATAPVFAGNQITVTAENSPHSKVVLMEEHHHYGTSESTGPGNEGPPGKIVPQIRNTMITLVEKYKEEEGWMYPLPWEESLKLEPEEFYVELSLDTYSKSGLYSKGIKAKVEHVFDPLIQGGLPVQRVLIQGNAGFGKSSLCQKAAYDWSYGITTFRALPWESSLPVLIKLRFLDEDSSLEELILDLIFSHFSLPDVQMIPFIKSLGRNLLIILDGYDELADERQKHVQEVLDSWKRKGSLFGFASLLVTTRPTSDEKFLLAFEKHYFITSISDDNLELLIRKLNAFTSSFIRECVHKVDKLYTKIFRYTETKLLERCLFRQTGKEISLKEMPPLIIALICWVVKQPRTVFKSKDIIYNCLELLTKRCNEREKFGLTDEYIGELLLKFGLLCFKIGRTVIAESFLVKELGRDVSYLVPTGILKCSQNHRGTTVWEPAHKTFLDALINRIFVCDEEGSLNRSEIKTFLNSDISTSCCAITLHVSTAENDVLVGVTEIRYHGKKSAFLRWNDQYGNISYLHKSPVDLESLLTFSYVDSESFGTFARLCPSLFSLIKESNKVQDIISVHDDRHMVLSFALDENSINLIFSGTQNNFFELLKHQERVITINRSTSVELSSTCIDKVLGISGEDAPNIKPPGEYFADTIRYFEDIGESDVEILVHFNYEFITNEWCTYTLCYNSCRRAHSNCLWMDITDVEIYRLKRKYLNELPIDFTKSFHLSLDRLECHEWDQHVLTQGKRTKSLSVA